MLGEEKFINVGSLDFGLVERFKFLNRLDMDFFNLSRYVFEFNNFIKFVLCKK